MSDAQDPANNQPPGYVPPKVWVWDKANGGQFANINRPISGATKAVELPIGKHPLQLYSLGTPNGVKVTIMLEELLAKGHSGAEYDAWLINIGAGDQFGSDFLSTSTQIRRSQPCVICRSRPAFGCSRVLLCFSIWPKNLASFCHLTHINGLKR